MMVLFAPTQSEVNGNVYKKLLSRVLSITFRIGCGEPFGRLRRIEPYNSIVFQLSTDVFPLTRALSPKGRGTINMSLLKVEVRY